jgi:hypothetical protein
MFFSDHSEPSTLAIRCNFIETGVDLRSFPIINSVGED